MIVPAFLADPLIMGTAIMAVGIVAEHFIGRDAQRKRREARSMRHAVNTPWDRVRVGDKLVPPDNMDDRADPIPPSPPPPPPPAPGWWKAEWEWPPADRAELEARVAEHFGPPLPKVVPAPAVLALPAPARVPKGYGE